MKKILIFVLLSFIATSSYGKGGGFSGGRSGGFSSSARSSSISRPSSFGKTSSTSSFSGGSIKSFSKRKLYETFTSSQSSIAPSKKVISSDINKIFNRDYRVQRKQQFYTGYAPQPIYINAAPSNYGVWDAMLMWSILDNVGDRQMYYHHHDQPEMKQWRSDAQKLCDQGNKEVCDKLAELEREVDEQKAKGVKQDISYITPGVDPNIYSTTNVDVNSLPEVKICTGTLSSDYSRFANEIAANTKLKIKNVITNGSIDNLIKLSKGECHFAFAQNDTIVSDQLVKSITFDTLESALLVCHKDSGITSIKQISNKNTIYVGSDQNGSQFSLSQFIAHIPQLELATINSSKPVIEAVDLLDKDSCLFSMDTWNAPYISLLDKEDRARIVSFEDIEIKNYLNTELYGNSYINLTKKDKKHWWNSEKPNVHTLAVTPVLVTTKQWIETNPGIYYDVLMLNRNFLKEEIK